MTIVGFGCSGLADMPTDSTREQLDPKEGASTETEDLSALYDEFEVDDPWQYDRADPAGGDTSKFDLNDPRLTETVGLLSACHEQRDLKARHHDAAERSLALAVIGVRAGSPDRRRAIDDVAAVLAAYSLARDDGRPRLLHVEKALEAVLHDLTGIAVKMGLSRPASPVQYHARILVEQEVLRSIVDKAMPRERVSYRFQLTERQRVLSALGSGGQFRQGVEKVRRAARISGAVTPMRTAVEAARRFGLPRAHDDLAARCADDAVERIWGGIGLLADAVKTVLATFPKPPAKFADPADDEAARREASGRAAATHLLHPGVVLAWGALELFVAWAPSKIPSTSSAHKAGKGGEGNLSDLIAALHSAVTGDQTGSDLRDSLRLAVAAWKAGRRAVLFDGRTDLTLERRMERQRLRELDQYYQSFESTPASDRHGVRRSHASPDPAETAEEPGHDAGVCGSRQDDRSPAPSSPHQDD